VPHRDFHLSARLAFISPCDAPPAESLQFDSTADKRSYIL
jgi:hypothetical protein